MKCPSEHREFLGCGAQPFVRVFYLLWPESTENAKHSADSLACFDFVLHQSMAISPLLSEMTRGIPQISSGPSQCCEFCDQLCSHRSTASEMAQPSKPEFM